MASYYVWSGATGSANGSSWANAYTTLTAAFSGKVAGDVFYVAHDHAESTAGAVTLTTAGTAGNPSKVICANRAGSVPPVSADLRATAQALCTGSNIAFQGHTHYDGIIFIAGSAASTSSILVPNTSSSNNHMRFDNCSLRLGSTGASNRINFFSGNGNSVALNNTTMSFANVAQSIVSGSIFKWSNTPSALLGTIPTTLFLPSLNTAGWIECFGVDLSAAGAGKTLVGAIATAYAMPHRFVDCKLDAAVTKSAVPLSPGSTEIDFIRSSASGNYAVFRHRISGTLDHETATVRIGGASDGTTPISWKATTTANCTYSMPFECPPIAIWCDTTGVAKTATIEGIWVGGAVPNDDDCFLDCEFLGDASSPQGSFVNDGKASLLATAAAQTASGAAWGGLITFATWNPADLSNATLSLGDLRATTSNPSGGARGTTGKSSGKFYFEYAYTVSTNSVNPGISLITASLTAPIAGSAIVARASGNIIISGGASGSSIGMVANGAVIGVAVDLTAQLIWFRVAPAGNWNGSGTANPATGAGGVSISAISSGPLYPSMTGAAGDAVTANFGASAFTGAVPAGFTSGWPSGGTGAAFKLGVTFTPQQKGFIYARVKCAKASSTFYIDPLITLT